MGMTATDAPALEHPPAPVTTLVGAINAAALISDPFGILMKTAIYLSLYRLRRQASLARGLELRTLSRQGIPTDRRSELATIKPPVRRNHDLHVFVYVSIFKHARLRPHAPSLHHPITLQPVATHPIHRLLHFDLLRITSYTPGFR